MGEEEGRSEAFTRPGAPRSSRSVGGRNRTGAPGRACPGATPMGIKANASATKRRTTGETFHDTTCAISLALCERAPRCVSTGAWEARETTAHFFQSRSASAQPLSGPPYFERAREVAGRAFEGSGRDGAPHRGELQASCTVVEIATRAFRARQEVRRRFLRCRPPPCPGARAKGDRPGRGWGRRRACVR